MPLKEFRYLAFDKYGNRLTFVAGISSNPREIINLASAHRFREISPEACIQTMQHKDIEYIYVNYLLKTLRPHELELSAEASLHTALCKDWVRLVKIESASSIQKEAAARIYLDLQQALNTLVQQERTTAAIAQEVFQLESTVNKGLIYIGAFMHGVSSSAVDFAKWLKEASDVINPIVISFNAFEAANKANNTEEFIQGFSDIRRRELIEALGFDPSHITRAKFDEAWDVLTLVYNDDKIQRMLARFCVDYVKAQHSVTYFKVGGSAVFEIIFAAVLVAVTGGTALAVTATARAGHKIRQFKTVGTLLAKLADLTPQMRKKKAKIKQQTTPSNIYDYVGESVAIKTADNTLPPKSAKQKLPTPPKTMDEVHQRLDAAKIKLDTARANGQPLPTSPYSEADKFAMVEAGLQERFLVRVVESKYTGDQGSIGRPKPDGGANYWTTTYTQIEHADSDAKLINQALGIDHDPNKTYTLLIIDNEKATATGQMKSFIPTYDSLGTLAKSEMSGTNPVHIDKVMTPEYSATYAKHMEDAKAGGVKLDDPEQLSDFAAQKGLSAEDKKLLETRQEINKRYGANEHFTGNDLTKDNNAPAGKIQYGTVETYTQDKNPQTIGTLKQNGVITVVDLS